MKWTTVTCATCKEPFMLRDIAEDDESLDSVRPVNCSRCRGKLGHHTAVKWPES